MSKQNRRAQRQKPNRHQIDRVQDLRRGSRTSRHVVRTEPDAMRKYGIRAVLKSEGM